MPNIFKNHPTLAGESYWQHFSAAARMGCLMLYAGLACLIHAIFPFLFEHTASRLIFSLNQKILDRNLKAQEIEAKRKPPID